MKCPKCNKEFDTHSAISRVDNKTEICPECGIKEALENYNKFKENENGSKHL